MRRFQGLQRGILLTVILALLCGFCLAEGPGTEEKGLDLAEGRISVRYPAVIGMEDEALQKSVNDRIVADCGIGDYLSRAALLISGGELSVEWTGGVLGEIFSCAVSAQGELETTRTEHRWTCCNIDLRDGHGITFEELFTDGEEARSLLEAYLEETIAPELSAHLMNSELLPLPERFTIGLTGLTLLYPAEQLSTLSDRAGDIRIGWNVLRDVLDLGEGSILNRAGVMETISLSEGSAERIREMTESGMLPGVPARIGDRMKELTDRYHLLTDPDGYEDGRMFALEGGCFGGIYLLTDDLTKGWEDSTVLGIRADRGCFGGLCIGETTQEDWRAALGEADSTTELDAEKADANRMSPGSCDYYRLGGYQLQLYADEEGRLASVILTE